MNKLITTSLFAALATLAFAPSPARAGGDEAAAALGGFIGGVIVGSALDNDHHHHGRFEDHGRAHVSTRIEVRSRSHHSHHDHGYWSSNRVRVWVPGVWVVRYDDCGRRFRHFERGHYEHQRQRVWVRTGRHGRCDICG